MMSSSSMDTVDRIMTKVAAATEVVLAPAPNDEPAHGAQPASESTARWSAPIPYAHPAPRPIPLDAFPAVLAEWAEAAAAALAVPTDWAIMSALGIVGFVLGGKVHVRPMAADNPWRERTNLIVICIGRTGDNKTGLYKAAEEPLKEVHQRAEAAIRSEHERWASEVRIAERRAEQLEVRAIKAAEVDRSACTDRAVAAAQELAVLRQREPRTSFATAGGDTTPEGLVKLLCDYSRVMIASSEPTIFDLMSRYVNNGQANFDVFLDAKDGTDIPVVRANNRFTVRRPCLGMVISAHEVTARTMRRRPGDMKARGLIGRLVPIWPASLKGTRMVASREEEDRVIPVELAARYAALVAKLVALPFPADDQPLPVVSLSPEARRDWAAFANRLEAELGDGGALATLEGFADKAKGLCCSVALTFHVIETGSTAGAIGAATMRNAIRVVDALAEHAMRFDLATQGDAEADAGAGLWPYVLRLVQKGEPFTVTDLQRAAKARYPKRKDLVAPLNALAERHLIRIRDVPTGGRHKATLEVNPDVLARHGERRS